MIGELRRAGALDDRRFATRFAADKRELGGWGPERIREVLRERGVADELVEAALEQETDAELLARAVELLARRVTSLDGDRERARALGFLTRRGFGYEIAYEAVRRAGRLAA